MSRSGAILKSSTSKSGKAKGLKDIHLDEEVEIAVNIALDRFCDGDQKESREMNKTSGRLNNGIPQVPVRRGESDFDSFRQSLPVFEKQEEVVQIIKENKVVLIVGETGSGKTTQISQFLLDDCYRNGTACRIFCTQPRRLAAIAVAERVAAERGEKIGQTIGYQIRLESRVSPKTLLTFCTNGDLLRTLMAGDTTLSTVTHVIVEILVLLFRIQLV
ncbi:3'-5' RNA helicase YTHDC2-like [Phyllobates terribilis]|uniref:3'-5' RNA helicase YTHDC2-like n=1 Tax=Phyllobates terribilis TaxID=111132 RepID=UPI003CCA96AF